ncbi:hypothetical protein [Microbacterium sp. zg.Y909]|uniref:hypothetical protein n=1 Tax=Microbacterium sp. zg.Y909 TaxID=2969413 RepID=UPI00214BB033|nr:hypothetical protein [Microbacterium sp. zg.Y909]MCR2826124.1 hypothetical protein [Microbacterium sp. zg.Y909]
MILPDSQPWIEIAERARAVERDNGGIAPHEVADSADASRAEHILYFDYRRYSRLGWGTLAAALWLGACVAAALIPAGFTETLERERGTAWAATATGVVLALVLGAISVRMLLRLRRSGRALTRALNYWIRLPARRAEPPTFDPDHIGTSRIYTDVAFGLRMVAGGITASLGALGALLAARSIMQLATASPAELGAQPSVAVLGVLFAAGMLAMAVCLFAGIRRVLFVSVNPGAVPAAVAATLRGGARPGTR